MPIGSLFKIVSLSRYFNQFYIAAKQMRVKPLVSCCPVIWQNTSLAGPFQGSGDHEAGDPDQPDPNRNRDQAQHPAGFHRHPAKCFQQFLES
jgi:hypothetical protein